MNITAWLSIVIIVLVLALILFAFLETKNFTRRLLLLHKHISDSVQSKFLDITPSTQSLIEAAIEIGNYTLNTPSFIDTDNKTTM